MSVLCQTELFDFSYIDRRGLTDSKTVELDRIGETVCTLPDDSLLPENQNPLIITAAPWGPSWLPGDYPEDIAVSWDDQVQKAVDCFNAVRLHSACPCAPTRQTGKLSKKMSDFNYMIERLRKAVPKMVLQVGSIDLLRSRE